MRTTKLCRQLILNALVHQALSVADLRTVLERCGEHLTADQVRNDLRKLEQAGKVGRVLHSSPQLWERLDLVDELGGRLAA